MTPFSAKVSIAWWHLRCAWCSVKQAYGALAGDPWRDQAKTLAVAKAG